MKKLNLVLFFVSLVSLTFAQEEKPEFKPSGSAFALVFFNYNYDMTNKVKKVSSFEIKRSYFGYKYKLADNISTIITFDVGSNTATSAYTAFLKTAQLDWKVASLLKLTFGLMGLKQFNDQEHLWGYRYVYKSFQDEHGFGSSADLGINAEIKISNQLKADLFITNGEGFKKIQDDFGTHRLGADLVATPTENLTIKAYYDMMSEKYDVYGDGTLIKDTATISNLALFAGYKTKKFRVGAEYNMLNNGEKYSHAADDENLNGISTYASFVINSQFEVFGRFDQLASNTLSGTTDAWNLSKDGSAIIGGIQFAPVKGLKIAVNYQNWTYTDNTLDAESKIYFSFEYKF